MPDGLLALHYTIRIDYPASLRVTVLVAVSKRTTSDTAPVLAPSLFVLSAFVLTRILMAWLASTAAVVFPSA